MTLTTGMCSPMRRGLMPDTCSHDRTRVLDTRVRKGDGSRRTTYVCLDCGEQFADAPPLKGGRPATVHFNETWEKPGK